MHPVSRSTTVRFALMATVVLSLALAACNNSSSPSPSASAAASTTAGGGGEVTTIVISGSSFGSDLTLPAGTVIEFANHDGFAHTATEGQNGVADANARFDFSLADGETSDQVTLEAGVYHVTCKIHHSMNLTITVS